MRLWLCLALTTACGSTGSAVPYYNPDGGLFDAPWPTDDRLSDSGLDLTGFANPDGLPILDTYVAAASALPGWGTAAPIYMPFSELPDADLLPTASQSLVASNGLLLVDIDPDSDGYGQLIPLQWETLDATNFTFHDQLAVVPMSGVPLRSATTHALIVTTELAVVDPIFAERLKDDDAFQQLRDALGDLDLNAKNVAVATVFTTRDVLGEMDRLVAGARALPVPALSQTVTELDTYPFFRVFEGSVQAPLWQHGDIPYAGEGGEFRFDDAGMPIVAETLTLRLGISTPKDLSTAPADGFPVVLYAHGTGGDYLTFADAGGGLQPASLIGKSGMVGVSFDQPLHGDRGNETTSVDLHSFNYLNPTSARANFRQGGLDIVWLVQALRAGGVTFTTDSGEPIPIDSSRVLFEGHSQGGLTGGLALPWLGDDLRGAVLSGAGGGLSTTIIKRKNPLDIAALIASLAGLNNGSELSGKHPIVGMVQLIAEETDPLNYAPYYFARDGGFSDSPAPVLLTSGRYDLQTDHETAEALAVAALMPPVSPAWNRTESMDLLGLATVSSPARNTVTGFDGQPLTAGFSQWADGDHFVIFTDRDAALMVQGFLDGAAQDLAEIDTRP